jgi:Leu/Phe-tRNA-protein transferase
VLISDKLKPTRSLRKSLTKRLYDIKEDTAGADYSLCRGILRQLNSVNK